MLPPPPSSGATNYSTPRHPLLTPSGRDFAHDARVQNISSDPLLPCIMYWPDNELFPEQGKIRPSGLGLQVSKIFLSWTSARRPGPVINPSVFLPSTRPSSTLGTEAPYPMYVFSPAHFLQTTHRDVCTTTG
ncbi:hypothetical protein B0H10DRAFT_1785356 [Mycena sp. CBHHK59/15]|nr:hypothetical protein B0H10DRAFT_1785356 [Mycena sp. CBHHK59/15]